MARARLTANKRVEPVVSISWASCFLNVNRVLAFLCAHPGVRCAPSNWGGGAVLKSGGHSSRRTACAPPLSNCFRRLCLKSISGPSRCQIYARKPVIYTIASGDWGRDSRAPCFKLHVLLLPLYLIICSLQKVRYSRNWPNPLHLCVLFVSLNGQFRNY